MSKDNLDDKDADQNSLYGSDDDWGEELVDTGAEPGAGEQLDNEDSPISALIGEEGEPSDDDENLLGYTGEDDFFASGDEDDDDDDDDDDGVNSSNSSSGDNGMSKKKTYLIVAGALVFLGAIVGGGFMLTQPKTAPSPRPNPAPVAAVEVQPQASTPRQAEPELRAEPAQLQLEQEQRIEPRSIDQGIPPSATISEPTTSIDLSALGELTEKVDMVGVALVDLKTGADSSKSQIDALEGRMTQVEKKLDDIVSRLQRLEERNDQIWPLFGEIKDEREKAAEAKRLKEEQDAKKRAAKPRQPAKPAAKPAAPAKPAAQASSIAGYSVVATYPATSSQGMQPEKAWVTNGKKLVQLAVGSKLGNATVTRIEGTTVHTTQGQIRAPR